jgi:superfamily I DNA/RNA helicase
MQRTDIIDFDDMCWLPVALNLPVNKFDFLFVDEAQDTNKCQIALALMAMKESSRIVAVGDEYQSIYGFRGADVDAIPNLIENLGAETLPLSITYRCPKSHVELVDKLFPEIGLECSETAKLGIIRNIGMENFYNEVRPGDMILCRLNAPLVEPVFQLIRRGIKATIRGRDIGSGLINLIRRMKAVDITQLCVKLQDYARRESERLMAQEKNAQAQSVMDKVDTIEALCDGVISITELEEKIETIFSDDNVGIVFSTVHKAKGLEAERVYILNNELMPSKMAKSDWEKQQERNIQYVAYTRSLNELIFVS